MQKPLALMGVEVVEEEMPSAQLLDLRKAYPRVNKPAPWGIPKRYGLRGRFLQTLQNLH